MPTTVSQVIAQIGSDPSQFKLGMNEVAARLELLGVQAEITNKKIEKIRVTAAQVEAEAVAAAAKSTQLNVQGIANQLNAAQIKLINFRRQAKNDANAFYREQKRLNSLGNDDTAFYKQVTVIDNKKTLLDAVRQQAKDANAEVKKLSAELTRVAAEKLKLDKVAHEKSTVAAGHFERAQDFENLASARAAVSGTFLARLEQNAYEHALRGFNSAANHAFQGGVAIGGALLASVAVGKNIETQMLLAYHNTSLTRTELDEMRVSINKLAVESGADFGQLIHGFRAIENYGNSGAQSAEILKVAMKSAVASGADLSTTGELLAATLKTFKIPAADAVHVMDQLHTAANLSSLELKDLVNNAGPAYASAARTGVSLTEVNAAMVLFTRYLQGDAPRAVTQYVNATNKITDASAKTQRALKNLSGAGKAVGVDLEKDFSQASLRARGIGKIFEDIKKVADFRGDKPEDLAQKLIPNLRGTQVASILVQHLAEYQKIVEQLNLAVEAESLTEKQYAEQLETTDVQLAKLKNQMIVLSESVLSALLPTIRSITDAFAGLLKEFNDLAPVNQRNTILLIEYAAGALVAVGGLGKLVFGIEAVTKALTTFGVISEASGGLKGFLATVGLRGGIYTTLILGAAYAIYKAKQAYEEGEFAATKFNNQLRDNLKLTRDAAQKALDHGKRLKDLVDHYDKLVKSSKDSSINIEDFHKTLNSIADLDPNLIKGYDQFGNAITLIGDHASYARIELAKLQKQTQSAYAAIHQNEASDIAQKQQDVLRRRGIIDQRVRLGYTTTDGNDLRPIHQEVDVIQQYAPSLRAQGHPELIALAMASRKIRPLDLSEIKANKDQQQSLLREWNDLERERKKALGESLVQLKKDHTGKPKLDHPHTAAVTDSLKNISDPIRKAHRERTKVEKTSPEELLNRELGSEIVTLTKNAKYKTFITEVEKAQDKLANKFKNASPILKEFLLNAAKTMDAVNQDKLAEEGLAEARKELLVVSVKHNLLSERGLVLSELESSKYATLSQQQKDKIANIKLETLAIKSRSDAEERRRQVEAIIKSPLKKELSPFETGFEKILPNTAKSQFGFFEALIGAARYANNVIKVEALKTQREAWQGFLDTVRKAGEEQQKAREDFRDSLADSKKQADYRLIGAKNPDEEKRLEFYDRMSEKLKGQLELNNEAATQMKQAIADAWQYILLKEKQGAIDQRTFEITSSIAKAMKDLTEVTVINAAGVKISAEEWKNLNKEEQAAARQLVKMVELKSIVDEAMQGISSIISTTLNNLRENGFKSFFSNIIQGFEDMLFQLAAKWLTSYFVNSILKTLGGTLGGGGGKNEVRDLGDIFNFSGGGSSLIGAASGFPAQFGRSMIVGENGPELFIPRESGDIVPREKLSSGGGGVNINVTIQTNDVNSFRGSEAQISSRLAATVERSMARR